MSQSSSRVRLTPAELVIHRFRGVRRAARAIGIDHAWLARWAKPHTRVRGSNPPRWKGNGGRIPSQQYKKIIDAGVKHGVSITEHELIHGAVVTNAQFHGHTTRPAPKLAARR